MLKTVSVTILTFSYATHENVWKTTKRKTQNQMDRPNQNIEMRAEYWEEIQENKKWEDRDGWRFLCNS